MGNITNKPKVPAPQVVYVPQTVYEPAPSNNSGSDDNSAPTPQQQREQSLLSRNRSRLGTVLTGFRGLLAPLVNDNSGQRKTLLGE
jgi:hypothetical protein